MCSMATYLTPSMLYSSLPLCLSSCLQYLKSNYYDSWQHEPPHTRVPSRLNTMILSIYYIDYHPTPDKSLLTTTECQYTDHQSILQVKRCIWSVLCNFRSPCMTWFECWQGVSHHVHSWRTYELPVKGEVREGEYEHGEPNQPGYCMPMDVTTL